MATALILDLDNLAPRASVRVHGITVPLRTLEMMAPIERHRLNKLGTRSDELEQKPELSADEEKELESILGRMCQMVMKCDAEFVATMSSDEHMGVMDAFSNPSRMKQAAEAETAVLSPTGATPAPA